MAEQDTLPPTTTEGATEQDAPAFDAFTHGLEDDDAPADLIDPTKSPESADPDPTPTPEATEPKAEAPDATDGFTVDSRGVLHRKDGTIASKKEAEAYRAKQAAQAEAPVVEEPPPDPSADTPPVAEEPPKPTNAPWKPNLYGQEVEVLQGALTSPDGHLFIPKEQVALATALIARGTKYEEVKQERQKWASEREKLTEPYKAETQALAAILSSTLMDDNWMLQYAIDPEAAKREVSFRLKEAQLELREKFGNLASPEKATPPTQGPELDRYDAEHAARTELDTILNTADYHGLFTDVDRQKVWSALTQAPNLFVLMDNEWKMDVEELHRVVSLYAEAPKREKAVREQQDRERKATEAAKRNANAVPKPTEPPKPAAPKASTPDDPYADKPWENPALDAKDRRALYRKHLGLSA